MRELAFCLFVIAAAAGPLAAQDGPDTAGSRELRGRIEQRSFEAIVSDARAI